MSNTNNTSHPDDICLWPDGEWCYRSELAEFTSWKSDDYEVIRVSSERYDEVSKDVYAYYSTGILAQPCAQ
ncbi:hypothetical protein EGT07_23840 [Herbaspirillum sp. HC18]|nr:hypothetical protein EGT07_23840 [Herbaspirillum sp. HC18]